MKAITFHAVHPNLEEFLRGFCLPTVLVAVRDHGAQDAILMAGFIQQHLKVGLLEA